MLPLLLFNTGLPVIDMFNYTYCHVVIITSFPTRLHVAQPPEPANEEPSTLAQQTVTQETQVSAASECLFA
jgi:hypothetical protein